MWGILFFWIIVFPSQSCYSKYTTEICRNKTVKNTRYDWSSLNDRDISNIYTVTVRNNSILFGSYLRDIFRLTYMKISSMEAATWKQPHGSSRRIHILTKPTCRVPWELLAVRKKRDNVIIVFLCNKWNSTNGNVQKLKRVQRELTHTVKKKKNTLKITSRN